MKRKPGRNRYFARLAVERVVRRTAFDSLEVAVKALHLAGGEHLVYSVMDRPMWRRIVGRLIQAHQEGSRRDYLARVEGDPFAWLGRRL